MVIMIALPTSVRTSPAEARHLQLQQSLQDPITTASIVTGDAATVALEEAASCVEAAPTS